MQPGTVIVDLAAEAGGNCELTKLDERVTTPGGVIVLGPANLPAHLAQTASSLYARNLLNFIKPLIDEEKKELAIDWDDEIVKGTAVTRDGDIVNERVVETADKVPAKKTAKKPAAKKSAAKKEG